MSRYIEAETLKESILRYAKTFLSHKRLPITKRVAEEVINDVCFAIDIQKTADVVPVVHGHWIERTDYVGDTYYDCSACGESWTTIEGDPWDNGMDYCPHCGAKMDALAKDIYVRCKSDEVTE